MVANPEAFQQLSDAELATLGQLGVRRAVAAGEYLYRESDPGYDFYVVLSGAVEIVVNSEGKNRSQNWTTGADEVGVARSVREL